MALLNIGVFAAGRFYLIVIALLALNWIKQMDLQNVEMQNFQDSLLIVFFFLRPVDFGGFRLFDYWSCNKVFDWCFSLKHNVAEAFEKELERALGGFRWEDFLEDNLQGLFC